MKCGVLCSPQSHTTLVPACRAPCAACTHPGTYNLLRALGPKPRLLFCSRGQSLARELLTPSISTSRWFPGCGGGQGGEGAMGRLTGAERTFRAGRLCYTVL